MIIKRKQYLMPNTRTPILKRQLQFKQLKWLHTWWGFVLIN